MSESTKIQWATSTGNPWIGCTKVSPGCAHCYAAELDANRFSKTMGGGTKAKPVSHWGKGAPRFRTKGFWTDAIKWNRDAKNEILKRALGGIMGAPKYQRPRIFPSLCDWLDDEVPIQWLADFLKLIHHTPHLDWLLLTKRPENFKSRLVAAHQTLPCFAPSMPMSSFIFDWLGGKFPHNVWLGVSVEDQIRADQRIPQLLRIPAKIRFLSIEPLLGPISLTVCGIHWVIIGGESGPHARLCNLSWITSLVDQCTEADVPVFVKQLGGNLSDDDLDNCLVHSGKSMHDKKGGDPSEWPADLRVRQFPNPCLSVSN